MKLMYSKIAGSTALIVLFAACSPSNGPSSVHEPQQGETTPVAFAQVNQVLAAAIQASIRDDDSVESAVASFDLARSSFARETLAFNARARLKAIPELRDLTAEAESGVYMSVDRAPSKPGIHVRWDGSVRTDFLRVIRHSAQVARKQLKYVDADVAPFNDRLDAGLKKVESMHSFAEFGPLVLEANAMADEILVSALERRQKELADVDSGKTLCSRAGGPGYDYPLETQDAAQARCRKSYERAVERQKSVLEAHRKVELTANAEEIRVLTGEGDKYFEEDNWNKGRAMPSTFQFSLSEREAKFVLQGFGAVSIEDLDKMMRDIRKGLKKVEESSEEKKKRQESDLRRALIDFKRAMRGEFSNQPGR